MMPKINKRTKTEKQSAAKDDEWDMDDQDFLELIPTKTSNCVPSSEPIIISSDSSEDEDFNKKQPDNCHVVNLLSKKLNF